MAFFQTDTLWVNELSGGVAVLVLDVPSSETNQLGRAVLDDLSKALARLREDGRFRLLILRSGKSACFAVGPGIEELAAMKGPDEVTAFALRGQQVLEELASLPVPSVALIAGACQGPGLELAMACDQRVVVDEPRTRLGFADIEVGLMPAWGGTQRLPRLIGLERSLHLLLGDHQLSAAKALSWGLADGVARKNEDQALDSLETPPKRVRGFLPLRGLRQRLLEGTRAGRWLIYRGTKRLLQRRLPDDLPAPWEIFEAIRVGLEQGIEAGLERERAGIARLAASGASRNLLHLQGQRHQLRTVRFPADGARHLRRAGIIGTDGQARQLAFLATSHGCQVALRAADETALGLALFQLLPLFQRAVEQGLMLPDEVQKHVAAISGTTAWKGFGELDVVLESMNTEEDPARFFRDLEQHTRADTLLVSTSALWPLDKLRQNLKNPGRVAGIHFQMPLGRGSLVEVVHGHGTTEEVRNALASWVVRLGAIPVPVQDNPGLLVERVWMAAIDEAILLLKQTLQLPRIDEALRRFGMIRGPLELADVIGSTRLTHLGVLLPERFPGLGPFFAAMVDQGWLGQANRQGFYVYRGRGRRRPNSKVAVLAHKLFDLTAPERLTMSRREQHSLCRQRIVARTVIEAGWCVEEGLADADAVDLALACSGWAPHRGGPLTYARQHGIERTLRELEELIEKAGPRFTPCPALRRLPTP